LWEEVSAVGLTEVGFCSALGATRKFGQELRF
jgi:hypothetical protein